MLSRFLTVREQLLILALVGAAGLGAVSLYLHDRTQGPTGTAPAPPVAKPLPTAEPTPAPMSLPLERELEMPEPIQVGVAGEVRFPGLYTFEEGARVANLIDEAGGVSDSADLADINLAARLIDGSTLTVPRRQDSVIDGSVLVLRRRAELRNPRPYTISGWQAPESAPITAATPTASTAPHQEGLLDLNRASLEQIEALPGIGPALAGRIIEYRQRQPFGVVDDVRNVNGIGPTRLEQIRPLVTVGPAECLP